MFVIVYCPRDNTTYLSRRMGPNELLDARKFADHVADMFETEIDEPNGHIPYGSGDIIVEFRQRKNDSVCVWSTAGFYFKT